MMGKSTLYAMYNTLSDKCLSLQVQLAEKDKRIAELEAEHDFSVLTWGLDLAHANKRVYALHARIDELNKGYNAMHTEASGFKAQLDEAKAQHIRLANGCGISTDQTLEDFTTAVIEKVSYIDAAVEEYKCKANPPTPFDDLLWSHVAEKMWKILTATPGKEKQSRSLLPEWPDDGVPSPEEMNER